MENTLAGNWLYWRNHTVDDRNNVVIRHIHREANQLADKLANAVLTYREDITCNSNQQLPRGCGTVLKLDKIQILSLSILSS